MRQARLRWNRFGGESEFVSCPRPPLAIQEASFIKSCLPVWSLESMGFKWLTSRGIEFESAGERLAAVVPS